MMGRNVRSNPDTTLGKTALAHFICIYGRDRNSPGMDRIHPSNAGAWRISHFINRRPAVNIHHATRYSERIGLPLNRFITINFSLAGCSPQQAVPLLQKMITQRFAPWLRRTASTAVEIPPTYVWCMEASGGTLAAHIVLHMPDALMAEFERRLRRWLCGLFGTDRLEPSVLQIQRVPNLIGLKRYILKGVDPAWGAHLAVNPVPQGLVIGKRSGFSKNLGPAARTRGGYRPRRRPFAP
jgi:hypothetical protein